MQRNDISKRFCDASESLGLAHFAIAVGTKEQVDQLTDRLQSDGYTIADGPRTTGDGYYESVVLDPENNRIELTI
jgi:lactoylglutathione lyase